MKRVYGWQGLIGFWLLLIGMAGPVLGQSQHSITGGAYVSRGDYGAPVDTDIRYLPFSYAYRSERFTTQITVPWLAVEGLGNALVNVGGVSRARLANQRLDQQGLGDMVGTVTYHRLPQDPEGPFIDLSLELKVPTADDTRGLGTGEPDTAVRVDVFQSAGRLSVFGAVGYRMRGRSEVFESLVDSAFAELGLGWALSARWNGGMIFSHSQPAAVQSSDIQEVLPYLSVDLTPQWTLMGYVSRGLTVDSSDMAAGIQLTVRW